MPVVILTISALAPAQSSGPFSRVPHRLASFFASHEIQRIFFITGSVDNRWIGLRNALVGLFCTFPCSLDDRRTSFPASAFPLSSAPFPQHSIPYALRYATLPSEHMCTENLARFSSSCPASHAPAWQSSWTHNRQSALPHEVGCSSKAIQGFWIGVTSSDPRTYHILSKHSVDGEPAHSHVGAVWNIVWTSTKGDQVTGGSTYSPRGSCSTVCSHGSDSLIETR